MPKEYEKFKAEWAIVSRDISQALVAIRNDAQVVAQTAGILAHGAKEIGARVHALKANGVHGTKIEDFMADPEIKVMMQGENDMLLVLEKELKHMAELHRGAWAQQKTRFWDLRTELAAEIASRKKQVSTKVKLGNKSLPDMVKLLAEIDAAKDGAFTTWDVFVPEEIAQHRKEIKFQIQDEIDKSKEQRLTEFQAMMQEQGLNVRVLRGNLNRAKGLYQTVLSEVAKAETALKGKKAADLKAAQLAARKANADLIKIVDPYAKAPGDDWLRARIAESKDKAAVQAGIKNFVEMKKQAGIALVKIDHAKV
jgi:hypothetical protein